MTTAPARAASRLLSTISVRTALLAAVSTVALANSASAANVAACSSAPSAGNETCVIVLGDVTAPAIDALDGTDTLDFDDNGNTITVATDNFGTGANGVFVNFEEAIVRNGTTVNLNGSASPGAPVNWTIEGILNIANGDAIGNAVNVNLASTGVLNVNDGDTIGKLSGAAGSSVVIASGELLIAGLNGGTSTFAGVLSGGGDFTKAGAGIMTLTGTNTLTGALNVAGGILEIGVGGSIDDVTSVTTVPGGQLTGKTAYTINGPVTNGGRITGNVTINGDVSSSGGLLPGNSSIPPGGVSDNPGQDMGTIYINGNYTATASTAYVGMFVDLDAGTQDLLNINGNVTGTIPTSLFVVEYDATPDAGNPTVGNGIQLVNVESGFTVSPDAFKLSYTPIAAGPYQYLLRYLENYAGGGGDDGFFLQSFVRDEMIAHPALLTAGQTLISQCFRDGQRIPDSPKGATYGRAWVDYRQGSATYGADTGIDMDQDFSCSTGGMDWRMGYGWFGGISGGFGDTTVDLTTAAGPGQLDGDARLVELYASFTSSAFFVNLSAGYADMDWTYNGNAMPAIMTTSTGIIASAQAGVAVSLGPLAAKLIGSVNYDDTNCGEDCFGFKVNEDTGLVEAVGTVRIDGAGWGGSVRPWLSASYSDVLDGGVNTVSLGAVSIDSEGHREMISIDGGLQTYLDENFALFADGGYRESLAKDITGYKAGIGLKLYW